MISKVIQNDQNNIESLFSEWIDPGWVLTFIGIKNKGLGRGVMKSVD